METSNNRIHSNLEEATFGSGCFWCTEAVFRRIKGVHEVISGYSGGKLKNPTYHEVCSGLTGHAEVVRVNFDPRIISYEELLEVFFHSHDPTTLNKQGADVGTQYRSVIFYHNEEQKHIAEEVKNRLNRSDEFAGEIVTEISPLHDFYKAEESHQEYFENNPDQPYCSMIIKPKLRKLEVEEKQKIKEDYLKSGF